jgi:hypothetical protein
MSDEPQDWPRANDFFEEGGPESEEQAPEPPPAPPAEGSLAWWRVQVVRSAPDILSDADLQMHLRRLAEETRADDHSVPAVVSLELTLLARVYRIPWSELEGTALLELVRLSFKLEKQYHDKADALNRYREGTWVAHVGEPRTLRPYEAKWFHIPLHRFLNPDFEPDAGPGRGRQQSTESKRLDAALYELVPKVTDLNDMDFVRRLFHKLDALKLRWPPDPKPDQKPVTFKTVLLRGGEELRKAVGALKKRVREIKKKKRLAIIL